MTHPTDEKLLEELKQGKTPGLGILYERYKTLLFNYFLRNTGSRDASNDLLMETFERVYRYRDSYNTEKKVRPWIFRIATNLLMDFYKRSNRKASLDLTNEDTGVVDPKYPDEISARARILQDALAKLKPDWRRVVSMYYLLEMNYEDIASSEGISVNNARIKICRALKKLNELLKNSGV